jgi:hypothetical protein
MARKYTKKNRRKGGSMFPTTTTTSAPASESSWYDYSSYIPSADSFSMPSFSMDSFSMDSLNPFGEKKQETAYSTQGGRRRRRRMRMRGGSYSPNSSFYGEDAGPYSGPPTARAQVWVGGRKSTRKKRGKKCR